MTEVEQAIEQCDLVEKMAVEIAECYATYRTMLQRYPVMSAKLGDSSARLMEQLRPIYEGLGGMVSKDDDLMMVFYRAHIRWPQEAVDAD